MPRPTKEQIQEMSRKDLLEGKKDLLEDDDDVEMPNVEPGKKKSATSHYTIHDKDEPRQKRKAGEHRKAVEREVDRTKLIRMVSRDYSMEEIGRELNISTNRVYLEYKIILKQLRKERLDLTEEVIEQKLLEYKEIKREAWDAWERSKSSHIITKSKQTSGGMGGKLTYEDTQTTETRVGDNSYLAVVLECLKAEREIQGLDPEKKMRVSGNIINWDILANGIPVDGPVPDLIENEIRKGMDMDNRLMGSIDSDTIYVPKSKSIGDERGVAHNSNTSASSQNHTPLPHEPTLEDLENMATQPMEDEER